MIDYGHRSKGSDREQLANFAVTLRDEMERAQVEGSMKRHASIGDFEIILAESRRALWRSLQPEGTRTQKTGLVHFATISVQKGFAIMHPEPI